MPPAPWHAEISARSICYGSVHSVEHMLFCSAYIPYMPAHIWPRAPPGPGVVAEIRTHDLETAFGGTKQSGYGRERGIEALHGYTQLKTVNIRLSGWRASTCWRWHTGSS
ncbi:MAG: aldehyde dehydrogenase family protein [Marinibacterium sp.]|nr:aldehyde dehydrogenase family protein [Marinibacterium sp.]